MKIFSMFIFRFFIITDDRFNFIWYSNTGDWINDASLSNLEYKYQIEKKNAVYYINIHTVVISNIYGIYEENRYV